ncbi:MAG: DUF1549 domain-containing protein [Aureliella sp.]
MRLADMLKLSICSNNKVHQILVAATAVVLTGVSLPAQEKADGAAEQFGAEGIEFFEAKIRPVLVEHCAECHSNETEASGGLLVDARSQLLDGGDSGPAVDLETPDESLLLEVISYANPDLQMPPEEKLPESVLEDFRKWITMGLPDPRHSDAPSSEPQVGLPVERAEEHWAYRHRATQFHHDSIDGFIDAQLAEQGLASSGRAEPVDLLRRLTFDLNGLPPTREQIAAFATDELDDAYGTLVDQLLAQPAFGETFARHWMDVVRYAESITLRGFVLPNAWRYRNYLIDAYNEDRPIDQMIREQIAGDLIAAKATELAELKSDTAIRQQQQRLIATGFWAMGNTNLEQQDKTQLEMDYIDEQLEVMGRTFLGQTIGCARCHDHKFDPIPTRDYYALAGIMRSTVAMDHDNVSKWLDRPLPLDAASEQHFAELKLRLDRVRDEAAELKKRMDKDYPEKPKKVRIQDLAGYVVDDSQATLVGTWTPSDHTGRIVGTGYRYHDLKSEERKTATFEAEDLPPGEYEVRLAYSAASNRASKVRVDVFSADGEKTLTVDQRKKPPENGLWLSLGTYRFEKDGQAFVMLFSDGADGHVIADAVQFLPVAMTAKEKVAAPAEATKAQKKLAAELKKLEEKEKQLAKRYGERPSYLAIVQDDDPKDIPIHIRGDVHNLAEVVPRGVLTAIGRRPAIAPTSGGRMELANWLADAQNPLTARVYTNRVWTWLMGQGIVPTVNNFGTTGVKPTHPELLDWLTAEFIRSGWSTKHLVEIIVRSDAYRRRVVQPSDRHVETDPKNQLYWRGQSRRLTAEALRDAMLTISGELEPAPQGSLISASKKADYNYKHQNNSRSIYQPVFRNSLPDLFEAFDFADPSASVGQRSRSTVATQSLVLANHPWIVARADAAASRLMTEHADAEKDVLIDAVFMDCFARLPTMQEREIATRCLNAGPREKQLARLVHALFASLDFRYLR